MNQCGVLKVKDLRNFIINACDSMDMSVLVELR